MQRIVANGAFQAQSDAFLFEPETFAAITEYLARRNDSTQNADGVHVGDLFYDSWGWEQTNINYYQVFGLKGAHTAVLCEIACEYIGGFSMSGYKRPIRDRFIGDELYTVRTTKSEYYKGGVKIRAPRHNSKHYLSATTDFEKHAYSRYA